MEEVNIIKVDGKPLEKLIEVVSKCIGTIYRPRAIRRDAEVESYEIEIIERAKSKALAEGKEITTNKMKINRFSTKSYLYPTTLADLGYFNRTKLTAQVLNGATNKFT